MFTEATWHLFLVQALAAGENHFLISQMERARVNFVVIIGCHSVSAIAENQD